MKPWNIERFSGIAAAALLVFYLVARIHSLVMPKVDLWSFQAHELTSSSGAARKTQSTTSKLDFGLWSEKRVREYRTALGMKLDPPLAVLTIPRIGVQVPVFDGTDDLTLNRGAGRISGTGRLGSSGNAAIAAHRDGFFRGLKDVREGDHIGLAVHGAALLYTVDSLKIVDPSDVSVLRTRVRPSLTLVTCYPFYFVGSAPQRYIVQATLANPEKTPVSGLNSTDQKGKKESTP
jgi:sortase A